MHATCTTHPILLDLMASIILKEEYELQISNNAVVLGSYSYLSQIQIISSATYSLYMRDKVSHPYKVKFSLCLSN
jgi:hypothetical protein